MSGFPILKTGATAQYPLERSIRFSTQAVQFVDGSSQRYPVFEKALRRWIIRLDQLDEQELDAVSSFVEQKHGSVFPFTDPVTGESVANCSIMGEEFNSAMTYQMDGQAMLVIEETA